LGGLITRRVDASLGVQWRSAAIGLDERNFRSTAGYAQLRAALGSNLAAYASYYYLIHDFNAGVALPSGVVRELERQGFRVGLSTWLPLWRTRGAP
jgi:hypothetical protein